LFEAIINDHPNLSTHLWILLVSAKTITLHLHSQGIVKTASSP